MTHKAACLMGALAADAAALGLHWIYDPTRIASIAVKTGHAAFTTLNPAHFDGVRAYFAHGLRQNGALTHYGEVLHLAIASLIQSNGQFDQNTYQGAYAAHFGPGGPYIGYIDRPMRGALNNLANGQTDPSGIDDDQLPAIAALPAIVVATLNRADTSNTVARAIRVTNANDTANAYGAAFATLLALVLNGQSVATALHSIAATATGDMQTLLQNALNSHQSSTEFAESTGRACHLPMGLPLAFHILANNNSFEGAVEANIRAGGDSAGRAIIIGAVMGAAHGIGGEQGIPADYLVKMHNAAQLLHHCNQLAALL